MKALKKEKLEIILLVFFVMLGLAYAYVTVLFLPEWTVIQSKTSQMYTQNNRYQELLTYQKNQSGLLQDIKTLETKIDKLNMQIPNQLDKPQLMVGLYTLAKQHAVSPQTLTFEQAQTKGAYQELGMSFSSLGKPADILAMIHDLQLGGTQRIPISSVKITTQQGTMRVELKLNAYAIMVAPNNPIKKPDFMNFPIGVDSPIKMFQP